MKDIEITGALQTLSLMIILIGVDMESLILISFVSLTVIGMFLLKYRWPKPKNNTIYVCDLCGERHCECTRE